MLEGFRFEFGLRPFDMSVDVLLRSLYVEDKMVDDQTEFRHLVTSKLDQAEEKDLVRIRYQGVQKTSPEFLTIHEGIDKVSEVVWMKASPRLTGFGFPDCRCRALYDQRRRHSQQYCEFYLDVLVPRADDPSPSSPSSTGL